MQLFPRPSLGLAVGLSLVVAASSLAFFGPDGSTTLTIAAFAGFAGLWLALDAVGRLAAPAKPAAGSKKRDKWRIPAALDQPTPRRVRLKPIGYIAGLLWIVVAVLVVGVSELGMPRHPAVNAGLELLSTQALVADKSERDTAAGHEYVLTLTFETAAGARIRTRVPVTWLTYRLSATGDTHKALYLDGDASRHIFPELRRPIDPRLKYTLYAAGLGLLALLEWLRRRERSLVRNGAIASAEVQKLKVRGASRVYDAVFTIRGQTLRVPATERNRSRVDGDLVTVLYWPDQPTRACVYETSFYRARS